MHSCSSRWLRAQRPAICPGNEVLRRLMIPFVESDASPLHSPPQGCPIASRCYRRHAGDVLPQDLSSHLAGLKRLCDGGRCQRWGAPDCAITGHHGAKGVRVGRRAKQGHLCGRKPCRPIMAEYWATSRDTDRKVQPLETQRRRHELSKQSRRQVGFPVSAGRAPQQQGAGAQEGVRTR